MKPGGSMNDLKDGPQKKGNLAKARPEILNSLITPALGRLNTDAFFRPSPKIMREKWRRQKKV